MGKKPVAVPEKVKVQIADHHVTIEGPLGRLEWDYPQPVTVSFDENARMLSVARRNDQRQTMALHGLTRALLQNMVVGVTQGYEKRLEIVGVGYIAAIQGNVLQLRVGFANELQKPIPPELKVACPDQQHIVVKGIDKQKVAEFAAEVRALRPPEPYKGKGIRYEGEVVRRKQGKVMAK